MNDLVSHLLTPISASALVLGALAVFRDYFLSYSNEKAKNLAQKEDIEELTEKVQHITAAYALRNNEIEQKLSHLLSLQNSHRNEERAAVLEFYESYIYWMYTILEIPIDRYAQSTIDLLLEKKQELDDYFLSINKASAKMILLVMDQSLLDLHQGMLMELINFKGWTDRKLLDLQFALERWNRITDKFTKLRLELNQNMAEAKSIADEEAVLSERLIAIRMEYKQMKVSEFHKCKGLAKQFAVRAKSYLVSID
jgi:hypothetical protein